MFNFTKILLYLAILAAISSGVLFLIKSENKQPLDKKEPLVEEPTTSTFQTKISEYPNEASTFVGILRSSGLTQDQKTRMKLQADSILVFEPTTVLGIKHSFVYLGSGIAPSHVSADALGFGKCVVAQGIVDYESLDGSGLYNGEASLGGLVLREFTVSPVSLDTCRNVILTTPRPQNVETIKITGTIKHISRPSPDINYDYVLESPTTIPGVFDMSGLGNELKSVVVLPNDFEVYKKLENTLGQEITVSGYLQWGYAESQSFTIETIY